MEGGRGWKEARCARQGASMTQLRSFCCSDVVPNCRFIARSPRLDDVLVQAVRHIAEKHHVREITPEIAEVVRRAVHTSLADAA